jgi:hypothetical protein
MIKAAFQDIYWNSNATTPDGYTQMEANFSFYWGLAIQLYESTLVSDQTPFDRFLAGDDTALTPQQMEGLGIFYSSGRCFECHGGPELTNASFNRVAFVNNANNELVNFMFMGPGVPGIYDEGYYNVAVRPTSEDIGRGGTAPFLNPLDPVNLFPLSFSRLAKLQALGRLPFSTPVLPPLVAPTITDFVQGSFKVPSLRNVELTPPYLHTGGAFLMDEVVDFYSRGGNFPLDNMATLPPSISEIEVLAGSPERMQSMVAFLKSFTDERVRNDSAPFDHPEIFIPNGEPESEATMIRLPATDAAGHAPPLQLTLTPAQPSPQQSGTGVIMAADCGSPDYQYRFWLFNTATAAWTLGQDYGVGATWLLPDLTPVGNYVIAVDARRSPLVSRDAVTYLPYELNLPAAAGVTITPSAPAPHVSGTPVQFAADAGAPGYQYRFWLYDGANWNIIQEYGQGSAWTMPEGQAGGDYMLAVEVRGSTGAIRDAVAYLSYQVLWAPATGVEATPDQTVHTPGTDVIFTAAGQGSSGYDYRFWLFNVTTSQWTMAQDYGNGPSWTMPGTTDSGNYVVAVDVRTNASVIRDAVHYLSYLF